jgi:hypothetical protein
MDERNKILLYGLSAEEMQKVMKVASENLYIYTETWQDIIAVYANLSIVNPNKLSEEAKLAIAQFYKEIEPAESRLVLTCECKEFNGIKNVEICKNMFQEEAIVKTTILRCLHENERDIDFSRRLMLALKIMKCICNHPGKSTKELAQALEISDRSVKRYIEALRTAGADIVYENKGWKCNIALWDL